MADGTVTFSTALDNAQLEKDLAKLAKKIESKERELADLERKRDRARADSLFKAGVLDKEKEKLQELKRSLEEIRAVAADKSFDPGTRETAKADIPKAAEALREQRERVRALQSDFDKAAGAAERYEEKVSGAEALLARQKEQAGELVRQLDAAGQSARSMGESADQAGAFLDKLKSRLNKLASRVFVFTLITSALRGMRTWLGKVIRTNDEARQAVSMLKGALLTLAQPLVEVVIPAFITLVNILARVVAAIANALSMLFGKTLQQSRTGAKALYGEANAIGAVGDAAEEAAGSLAGFDEINTISPENASGGGGGASEAIAPDFSWLDGSDSMLNQMLEILERIAPYVGLIGAGFALWKIGETLPGILGTIATKLGLILIALGGILVFWDGLTDAWENGVDWGNLIEMILGLAAAAGALYALLGPAAAGIALVVGGLAMLAAGFRDAMENGWNLQNTLLSIAGILAAGAGIALMTGSWIPLLIAGIASLLLALTAATGHGEELIEGIKKILEGFRDFFVGIFTGDIELAAGGIEKIFDGLKTAVFAVVDGVKDSLLSFLDWLDKKTGGRFHGIIETAKGFVTSFYDSMKSALGGWIDGVQLALQGLLQFLTGVFTNDWDLAWEGCKNIFKGMWNSSISMLENAVNFIIQGLNWLIAQMNKIEFEVPGWVPGVGGKSLGVHIPSVSEVSIPRLAQGAVIPPNREFLAVLGDQSAGTNIEAPEGLIRQLFREELGETAALLRLILEAVRDGHVITIDGMVFGRTAIRTINSVNTAAGKQLLIL